MENSPDFNATFMNNYYDVNIQAINKNRGCFIDIYPAFNRLPGIVIKTDQHDIILFNIKNPHLTHKPAIVSQTSLYLLLLTSK